jgi:hypothetical protein
MGYTSGSPTNAQASDLQDWAIIEPLADNRNQPCGSRQRSKGSAELWLLSESRP